jgi:hypothetical protein
MSICTVPCPNLLGPSISESAFAQAVGPVQATRLKVSVRVVWVGAEGLVAGMGLGEIEAALGVLEPHPTTRSKAAKAILIRGTAWPRCRRPRNKLHKKEF